MSVEIVSDFPCGSWVKLTTRLGQDIEGEVISYDNGQGILLLKHKVEEEIETRACNIHLGKKSLIKILKFVRKTIFKIMFS